MAHFDEETMNKILRMTPMISDNNNDKNNIENDENVKKVNF